MDGCTLERTGRTRFRGWRTTAALVVWVGLGCAGASPHAEATSERAETNEHAETSEPDAPGPVAADETGEADGLSAYLRPVREMLDALDRRDADAVVDAFRPEARSEVRARITGFLSDPASAEELRGMLQQLVDDGRLIRADSESARIAVPIRYGPAINLVQRDGRWYVEDMSETLDDDFPGELPEEEDE